MKSIQITSSSNAKYKYIKALRQKKSRKEYREFTVEGIKSVQDAVASGRRISAVAVSDSFYHNQTFSYPQGAELYIMGDSLMERLCDTQNPQGILAVIRMRGNKDFEPAPEGLYVYCDGLNDPGNLGTVIRTADAAGFSGVLLSPDCVDLYNPKTVRATMGSFFHMDIIEGIAPETLKHYQAMGFSIFGGALSEDTIDYRRAVYKKGSIIVVGNEANGISQEILNCCTCVKIPIYGGAESLNVGVAAGILMYEAANQIHFREETP